MKQHDAGRRDFFRKVILTGSGLMLGVQTGSCARQNKMTNFQPNLWLTIKPDNTISIVISKSEMGQGVRTSLAMLVAEELDADWNTIEVTQAETAEIYGSQATAGSTSIRDLWLPLRQAGASARLMLIQAAAETWKVDVSQCATAGGHVIHSSSGRAIQYGDLVQSARHLPVPQKVSLKPLQDFRLIGRSVPRLDNVAKVTGQALFGVDQVIPGLKYAAIRQAPVFGARVAEFDKTAALAKPGVRAVVELESAVAVVADSWWQAQQVVDGLALDWQGGDTRLDDDLIRREYQALLARPGTIETELGKPADSRRQLTADYEASFQAHATMEPMNCTVRIADGMCEIWAPTQHPQHARDLVKARLQSGVAKMIGKAKDVVGWADNSVKVYTTLLGGGFGRRLEQDYVLQAVDIAQQTGLPIKLIWSRSEDIQHDFYRPFTCHRLQADLDDRGNVSSWQHRIAGSSHGRCTGGAHIPYAVPHYRLDYHVKKYAVPIGSWRSVGSSHNAFVTECFMDELAHAAGVDAWQYRRQWLKDKPRVLAVMDKAAELAQWGKKLASGQGLGMAIHDEFGSIVCQVAEVLVVDGKPEIKQLVCVVDCGMVVNPAIVTAQIEGGIAFGLTAALHSRITIGNGRVQQSNFHDFALLTMREMPLVRVHIIPSDQPPGGIGEVGVPPVAPAIGNAIFAATGKRLRSIPMHFS